MTIAHFWRQNLHLRWCMLRKCQRSAKTSLRWTICQQSTTYVEFAELKFKCKLLSNSRPIVSNFIERQTLTLDITICKRERWYKGHSYMTPRKRNGTLALLRTLADVLTSLGHLLIVNCYWQSLFSFLKLKFYQWNTNHG